MLNFDYNLDIEKPLKSLQNGQDMLIKGKLYRKVKDNRIMDKGGSVFSVKSGTKVLPLKKK